MKKRPINPFAGSSVSAVLVTLCLAASPAFAVDYYHLNTSAARSRLDVAADYSTTNGSTTPAATGTINSTNDNLFFYNSAVTGPVNREFVLGASARSIGSMTFGSNAGTTQIDRDGASLGGGSNTVLSVGAGGITVAAGAGAVTFGSLATDRNQRVTVRALADFTVANNSSNNLSFIRDFDGGTDSATRTVTVAGSGNGDTIFNEIKIGTILNGRNIAMTINKTPGTGVVRFNGVNTYTGDTTVTAGMLALADNAQLKFVLGATSGVNNRISGAGTVTLNGDFVVDTAAADALPSGSWTIVDNSTLTETYGSTFTVVGFTNAGGDKWTKEPIAGKLYTFDETTGILTLETTASAYDIWKAANTPGSNPDNDTDGDGVTNAVEFVLGGTSATNDIDKLPKFAADGTNVTFTFFRKQSSIDAKTALLIETSTDLTTWNIAPSAYTVPDGVTAGPPVTVVKGVPVDFDTVTLTMLQDPAKKFARLKVVITP